MLRALLKHQDDEIALRYMGKYKRFLERNLFVSSIQEGNSNFIETALLDNAFV